MTQLTEQDLERQWIRDNLESINDSQTLVVDELIEKYGPGIELDIDISYWYDDAEVTVYIRRNRLETDEEYSIRIEELKVYRAKQAKAAEKRRETLKAKKAAKTLEERKLYEMLKAKYGKDD